LLPNGGSRFACWTNSFPGKEYLINGGKTGILAEKLYNEILQIQYGLKEDPFGWRVKIAG